jgi:hypothetical protein
MLRRNPDALALIAIVLFLLALQARPLVAPWNVNLQFAPPCTQIQMQQGQVTEAIQQAIRGVVDSLHP